MAEYFLERRRLTQSEMTMDIARHLQARQLVGKAVVVTERCGILLSAVRRQWMRIVQALQRENARTLDAALKAEFTRQLEAMQNLRFVAKTPQEAPEADVYFVEAGTEIDLPPGCQTVYFCAIRPDVTMIERAREAGCVVVVEYFR